MNIVERWCADILHRSSLSLDKPISVEGVRRKHLGPRSDYARIEVLAEPSPALEIAFSPHLPQDDAARLFLNAAVFGLLDILLASEARPLRDIKLTITAIDVHPVDSSQMAFQYAGRDAGTNIMRFRLSK